MQPLKYITMALAIGTASWAMSIASAEELSVATFVPPQHHSNTVMFKWFGEELETRSSGSLRLFRLPLGSSGI
ncbi:MAG: hypothetical protein KTR35_08955 [Gammaproteobacteria bacterium]|nr:hypothetical protein [Gammaproteobacteria bacterium]